MDIINFKNNIVNNGRCTKISKTGDVTIKVTGLGIGGSFTILFNHFNRKKEAHLLIRYKK